MRPCLQKQGHCFWWKDRLLGDGPEALGYPTWDSLWQDYTVFAVVRNPFDRAASSYQYIYAERQVSSSAVRAHPHVDARARPCLLGVECPASLRCCMLMHTWIARYMCMPTTLGLPACCCSCAALRCQPASC